MNRNAAPAGRASFARQSVRAPRQGSRPRAEGVGAASGRRGETAPRPIRACACACGGGCPRCLPASQPGDALERDADQRAANALRGARGPRGIAAALGVEPASVAIHADAQAARSARALHAHAYTVGSDVYFGAGQFAPHTDSGARLLAHELAHVAQQQRSGTAMLQRQSADVTLPPARITGALKPTTTGVRDLAALTTPAAPGELVLGRGGVAAPDSSLPLPFTSGGGWEAGEILTRLGQFDDLPGTDSDANRCVQAVAMASHIVEGPGAVAQFVRAVLLDAALSRPNGARENKAREVLEYFIARLDNRLATYGDVSWAQEALHDLFYADAEGTPETDVAGLLAKTNGPERVMQALDIWCESPAEVVTQARLLKPGEQLLIVPTTVIFNQALDEAAPNPTSPRVDETDVLLDGRSVHVRRFDASARPPASAISAARDKLRGHQMLVMRDSSTSELRVYEPEAIDSGDHFMELDTEGRNFERDFRDRPELQVYGYVHVIGKLSPKTLPPRMFARYQPSWI